MRKLVAAVVIFGCAARPAQVGVESGSLLAQIEASRDLDAVPIGASDATATVVIVMASWCSHCRNELRIFDAVRAHHPRVRWLAINYKPHEEYDGRGNAIAVRALAHELPWLRIVPAGEPLFDAIGRPPLIPTVLVFDRGGQLVERFDPRERRVPDRSQIDALLAALES